jgi:iron complex outermembrane receptor protein
LAYFLDSSASTPYFSRTLNKSFGNHKQWAVRATTDWNLEPKTRLSLRLETGRMDGDSTPFQHVGLVGAACPISTGAPGAGNGDESLCTNTSTGYSDTDGRLDAGDWNIVPAVSKVATTVALRADHELSASQLTSLSSYSRFRYAHGEDDDMSPLPLLQILYGTHLESFSQELRWSALSGSKVQWIVGILAAEDRVREQRSATLEGLFGDLLTDVSLNYRQRSRSLAVFGQIELAMTDRLRLNMGARQTRDTFRFSGGSTPGPGAFSPAFVAAVFPGLPATGQRRASWSDLSGRIGIELDVTPHTLMYGSLSRGYKPGGVFGGFGLAPEAFTPFGPEHVHAAEIGLKWQDPSDRMALSAATFAYDYRSFQAQRLVPAVTGAVPQLGNVGNATVYGAETSLRWLPADGIAIRAAAGWLHTRVRTAATALDSLQRDVNLRGNELPMSPSWSYQASVRYAPSPGVAGWRPYAQVDAAGRASYWVELVNQRHLKQSTSSTSIGASVGARSGRGDWDWQLWGRNLTNERHVLHGNSSGIGNDILMMSEGRSFGIQLRRVWE